MVSLDFGAVLSQWPALLKGAAFTLALSGVAAVGGMALGVACGWYVDNRKGTGPWGLVVGAILGSAVGFYNFFLEVMKKPEGKDG